MLPNFSIHFTIFYMTGTGIGDTCFLDNTFSSTTAVPTTKPFLEDSSQDRRTTNIAVPTPFHVDESIIKNYSFCDRNTFGKYLHHLS